MAEELNEVITRAAAKTAGLRRYFTGRPCLRCHIAERWVISGLCLECAAEWKRVHYVPVARKRMTDEQRVARERQVSRDSYRRNQEANKRRSKKWRAENAAHVRLYAKTYNQAHCNPIANRERVRAWIKANPLKKKQQTQIRRARKASAVGNFSPSDIEALLLYQGGLCCCGCDITNNYTIDHKTPLSRGGSNWPSNLQLLCRPCNSSKGAKTVAEWIEARGISAGMMEGIARAMAEGRAVEYRRLGT